MSSGVPDTPLTPLLSQASAWIQEDSCPEYLAKAEECLRLEEERVDNYLHQSSKAKLLGQVSKGVRTTSQGYRNRV